MEQQEIIHIINADLAIALPASMDAAELLAALAAYINQLIKTDFEKLVALLYRIDVHEDKLRHYLSNHANKDAGDIIAALIIERTAQKIKYKKEYNSKFFADDDEEKW